MAHGDPARSGKALAKVPAAIVALTRKQADALTGAKAAERIVLIGSEYRRLAGTAVAFVARHREEILSMRARYSQPGRRNPVPGCPTWEEVVKKHFRVSYSHISRLLAPPKEKGKEKTPRPAPGKGGAVAATEATGTRCAVPAAIGTGPAASAPAMVEVTARRVPTMESLAADWREVISGSNYTQEHRMADLFARVGVDPRWVIKAALLMVPLKGLAAVEVMAELWRLNPDRLDEAGQLKAFSSFLQNIWGNDWLLLERALEEVQPQVGDWEGTRGWTPEHLGLWGKDRATAIGHLLGKVDRVLKIWKAEAEKDPGHASDLLGRKLEGFMGQWQYKGMRETDRKKLEAYVELRSRPILDRAAALLKERDGK